MIDARGYFRATAGYLANLALVCPITEDQMFAKDGQVVFVVLVVSVYWFAMLAEVAESVTHAVADNIHYAADNLSSVMASAYSVFRQKTVEMQVGLLSLVSSYSTVHFLSYEICTLKSHGGVFYVSCSTFTLSLNH